MWLSNISELVLLPLNGLVTNQLPCGAVQFKRMYTLLISPGYLLGLKYLFLWEKNKFSRQRISYLFGIIYNFKKSYQHKMSHGGGGEMERETEI